MDDLTSLHSAMDRLFSEMFESQFGPQRREGGQIANRLAVDVERTDQGYRITAPVPGFKPEDVEVTFSDGILTISAMKKEEKEQKDRNYLRREVARGSFIRQIALPPDVDQERINANFQDGMLTIDIPRTQKAQPKKIEVKPGRGAAAGAQR
jgi:HSP20 family protein